MKPKVLIVEDELITATEFKEAMQAAGFEVPVVADRISSAMAAFETIEFDLVLLDITLKHDSLDGLYFAKQIRKTSEVPIIFITGDSNETMLDTMNALGNINYMMKAVRTPELIFKAKMMIGKKDEHEPKDHRYQEIILLPINKAHQKVKKSDIVAIKANGSYSDIYIATETQHHTLSMNMKKLLDGLHYDDLFRLNKSNVINVNFIERIEKDQLILNCYNLKYALAKGQKKEILERLPSIKT